MRQRYTHSGRVPPLGPVLGIGFSLAASLPLSFLYDYGIMHVPYVKMRALFTMLFGIVAGTATGWGMTLGKVRNNRVAAIVGLVASVAALYISWATWLILLFDKPLGWLPNLLARPVSIWQLMGLVNVDGTWTMSGAATKGTELWIIWAIEAGTILIFGSGTAFLLIKKQTFCENCDHWCKKGGEVSIVAAIQPADLLTRLNQGGLDFLTNARLATAKQPRYSFTWHSCPSCSGLNTLRVNLIQPKKGKEIADHLMLSAAEVELLRNFQGKTQSAAVLAGA